MIDFERGCAVITGGSSGIGHALASVLAERGMSVVLVGRDAAKVDSAAAALAGSPGRVKGVTCDVSDRAAVAALGKQIADEWGPVELLALNAGVTTAGPLVEHSPQDWDWVYGSVLLGVVHGIQTFLAGMLDAGHGHILITGSMAALVPDYFVNHGPYVSAKSAVMGLGTALHAELATSGVGLSVLIPAAVETALPDSHVRRPSVASGAMAADEAPHPAETVVPAPGAPALSREFRFLQPAEVAERVVDSVQRDELFILTHPEFRSVFADYSARVLRAFDNAAACEGRPA